MKQTVNKADIAKAAQSQSVVTDKQPELHKTPDPKTIPETQPISRFLEASCDCV